MTNSEVRPSVAVLQGVVLVAGALFFLVPISTPLGLLAAVSGIAGACWVTWKHGARIRSGRGAVVGLGAVLLGWLVERLFTSVAWPWSPEASLVLADALSLGLIAGGVVFTVRVLAKKARALAAVEFALVVGAVAHAFAAHRHERIHQPRVLADFAWTNGVDPQTLLAALGVVVVVMAALLLLRVRSASRAVAALLIVVLLGLLALQLGGGRPVKKLEDDELGLSKDDGDEKADAKDGEGKGSEGGGGKGDGSNKDGKGEGKGDGNGGGSGPPQPVAVVLLQDELPDTPVLYFRQAVRSKQVGDSLVQDTSGQLDPDVPVTVPAGGTLTLPSPQSPDLHKPFDTTMFLLVDHAQLPALGHPDQLTMLENPDPRRFVAAYSVRSNLLVRPPERLFGREANGAGFDEARRAAYLALPDDPRYRELSDRIVRDVDPRFVGDDVMKAFAIKQFLEKEGFYSLAQKQLVGETPTANFLFGEMKGYCVHFAHAATFLFRSQGIPARVALGYAVQTNRRGAGSSVLIYGNDAHAWPEVYLEGVGWVTFDIYPERSDEPPRPPMEQELEVVYGELARKDATGGRGAPLKPLELPWGPIALGLVASTLVAAYAIKLGRRLARSSPAKVYRAVLDHLSDAGQARHFGESRERHAQRLSSLAPSFAPLTDAHLRLALKGPDTAAAQTVEQLARATVAELRAALPLRQRLVAALNPIGWWFTR
ncbi:MAG: transglutaminase-like domain-containing protein [Myxococcaceae bacterium]|nr:transglutaminase-like domain-containing protein [Myxococcaceae bacterium]